MAITRMHTIVAMAVTVIMTVICTVFAGSFLLAFGSSLTVGDNSPENTGSDSEVQQADNSTESSQADAETFDPFSNATRRLFVLQGTVSSPGNEAGPFQIVDILPAREDGRLYQGTITFTATKPIVVAPLLRYGVAEEILDQDFGDQFTFPGGPQGSLIAPALIRPQYGETLDTDFPIPRTYSASVAFTGNGLSVGNLEGEHFIVTYALHATVFRPQIIDSVGSAITQLDEINGTKVSIVNGSAFLEDTAYDPNPVTISAGQNVTWINDDLDPHTVTSGSPDGNSSGNAFDSGYMGPHRSFSHMFEEDGEFPYYCQIHPNMVGTVIVEADTG